MENKPGYKTTEFYLAAASQVIGLVLASGLLTAGPILQVVGVVNTMLTALGYGWLRNQAKAQAAAPKDYKANESESIRTSVG